MISLIVNPASGGGRAAAAIPGVRRELERRGIAHTVHETESLGHARGLARSAGSAGRVAVALGGDGLVSAVATGLRGSDGVFGILPGGRGNDFARFLGIPLDPVAACEVLQTGSVSRLDLGCAGGQPFLGVASCGLDSDANRIANQTRMIRGRLGYVYGGLRALTTWKAANFRVRLDGERLTIRGYTIAVANSSMYGGGMRIAPDASTTDGLLDVVLISDRSRLRFLRHLPKVFSGTHASLPFVRIVRASHVEVDADRPFTVYADGDPIAELPVRFGVEPGAVCVRVPVGNGPPVPDMGP
jgi:YegS/Rv2252/BmrU family lipid kinase